MRLEGGTLWSARWSAEDLAGKSFGTADPDVLRGRMTFQYVAHPAPPAHANCNMAWPLFDALDALELAVASTCADGRMACRA